MAEHAKCLVHYAVGNVEKEEVVVPTNFVKRCLILVAHNEMTAQANSEEVDVQKLA